MKKKWLYWLNGTIISLVVIATVVLAVVFSVNTHKINYYDCGVQDKTTFTGTFEEGAPKKHRNGTETFLVNPVKAGYNFDGWYFSYDGKGNKVIKLAADIKYDGKINVYAKWSAQTYIIKYKDMSIGGEDKEFSGTHGDVFATTHTYGTETVLDTPTRTGYTFMGYYTQNSTAGGKVTSLSATGYTGDITLYALWVSALDAPTGLTFNPGTKTLSWNAVNNAIGYDIYDRTEKLNTTPITGTTFTVGTRPVGTCRFTVVAVSVNTTETMDFNSAHSEEVTYIVEPEESSYTNRIDVSADGKTALGFYDKNSGTLTILGEGRVDESIIDKINEIGEDEAKNITTIDLSNSAITTIDKETFGKFTGITNIQSGSSVKTIGSGAFYMCDTLETVDLPDGIISIGDRAFRGCTNLSEINLPDTVTNIGREAFYNCTKLGEIVIPGSVKKIPTEAFYGCTWLTSVIMEEGVEEIGYNAFRDCTGLTNVSIPETLTRVEEYAFYYAGSESNPISDIIFSDSLIYLGAYAFCSANIRSITIGKGLKEIRTNTFEYSTITNFKADNIELIADNAFCNCSNLVNISLPSSLKSIGDMAFSLCGALDNVMLNEGLVNIGNSAFHECVNLTSITIPESVTSIGNYAFYCCANVTSIIIHEGIISIGEYAFYGCANLTSMTTIPISVANIGKYAFSKCKSLLTLSITGGNTKIGDYVFSDCTALNQVELDVKSIGDNAFNGCTALASVELGSSIMQIGQNAFSNTQYYTNISNGVSDNLYLTAKDGTTKYLLKWKEGATGEIIIDPSIMAIAGGAFLGCASITGVVVPDGISVIGSSTFSGCAKLTNVVLPNGLTTICDAAFSGCSALRSIIIPEGVISIGKSAFAGCTALKSINLPNSVTSVDAFAFGSCTSLTTVVLPNGLTTICEAAFFGCSALKSITIPESVTFIGNSAFSGSSLTSITIPANVISIGNDAFVRTGLTEVVIDSAYVAGNIKSLEACGGILKRSPTTYIKQGLDVSGSDIFLQYFEKQETSDKAGYDKYILKPQTM